MSSSFIMLSSTKTCFLTCSCYMRKVVLIMGWVEFPTVFVERFMMTSAWDTPQDGLCTIAGAMPLVGTSPTDLWFDALVSFVIGDFLALVILLLAFPVVPMSSCMPLPLQRGRSPVAR